MADKHTYITPEMIDHDRTKIWTKLYIREACVVCGGLMYSSASDEILAEDVIRHNGIMYLIPSEHKNCKELFELNPLAYEIIGE